MTIPDYDHPDFHKTSPFCRSHNRSDIMKVAYIIGPIRSKVPSIRAENIKQAAKIAVKLWNAGFAVICPHTNTGFIIGKLETRCLKGDIELLRRSDFAILVGNWTSSKGSIGEFRWCVAHNKRIYSDVKEAIYEEKNLR